MKRHEDIPRNLRIALLMVLIIQIGGPVISQSNIGESPSGFLTSMPPEAPLLTNPADLSIDMPAVIELSWFSQIHTSCFSLLLSTSPDLSSPLIDMADLTDTVYTLSGLENSTSYYWQVTAGNVAGEGNPSPTRSFTTIVALPGAPVLEVPTHEAVDVSVETILKWNTVPDAETYHLLLSASPDLSNPVIDQSGLTDTVYDVSGLDQKTTYYWQVTAANVAGDGDPSSAWSFSTASATSVGEQMNPPENGYSLKVYPNPFDETIRIEYQLPEESMIIIAVYNILGQVVQYLDAGLKTAGSYQLEWNGKDQTGERVKSGLYFCLFKTGKAIVNHKMILIDYN